MVDNIKSNNWLKMNNKNSDEIGLKTLKRRPKRRPKRRLKRRPKIKSKRKVNKRRKRRVRHEK